jgi:hypothetical protein
MIYGSKETQDAYVAIQTIDKLVKNVYNAKDKSKE